jgi:hypothetical protein
VAENLEEKEFAMGLLGMSPEVEWGTNGDLRKRLTSSSQRVLLFGQEWENPLQSRVFADKQLQRRGE